MSFCSILAQVRLQGTEMNGELQVLRGIFN